MTPPRGRPTRCARPERTSAKLHVFGQSRSRLSSTRRVWSFRYALMISSVLWCGVEDNRSVQYWCVTSADKTLQHARSSTVDGPWTMDGLDHAVVTDNKWNYLWVNKPPWQLNPRTTIRSYLIKESIKSLHRSSRRICRTKIHSWYQEETAKGLMRLLRVDLTGRTSSAPQIKKPTHKARRGVG